MPKVRICRYDSSLKDQLVEFLGLQWRNKNFNERKKLVEWIYESNPYTKRPFRYLVLYGDRIIAQRSFVIQKLTCNSDEFLVGISADTIVHPDFRRQGLFSSLTNYAFEDMRENSNIRFLLSLSSNEASTAGYLKCGFISVGEREYMYSFYPVNGLKKLIYESDSDAKIRSERNNVMFEITNELKISEIYSLMQSFTEKSKIRNIRDKEFYTWRFGGSPYEHVYAYSREGGKTTGYLALQKTSNKYYSLMEYAYLKSDHFIRLIKGISEKVLVPSILVPVFTRNQGELLNFRKSGFKYSGDRMVRLLKAMKLVGKSKLPGLLIKPISSNFNDSAYFVGGVDTRFSESWSLFQSDVW